MVNKFKNLKINMKLDIKLMFYCDQMIKLLQICNELNCIKWKINL